MKREGKKGDGSSSGHLGPSLPSFRVDWPLVARCRHWCKNVNLRLLAPYLK